PLRSWKKKPAVVIHRTAVGLVVAPSASSPRTCLPSRESSLHGVPLSLTEQLPTTNSSCVQARLLEAPLTVPDLSPLSGASVPTLCPASAGLFVAGRGARVAFMEQGRFSRATRRMLCQTSTGPS